MEGQRSTFGAFASSRLIFLVECDLVRTRCDTQSDHAERQQMRAQGDRIESMVELINIADEGIGSIGPRGEEYKVGQVCLNRTMYTLGLIKPK